MAFDMHAKPDGDYPHDYVENGHTWPDDEYARSPFLSAKFARSSPVLEAAGLVDDLYGVMSSGEAVDLADRVAAATHDFDDLDEADADHYQRLAGLAQWLRYWGSRGVDISGGP